MSPDRAGVARRLLDRLVREKRDRGWGYYAGKSGRIESTCWALLALGATWDTAAGAWRELPQPESGKPGASGPDAAPARQADK